MSDKEAVPSSVKVISLFKKIEAGERRVVDEDERSVLLASPSKDPLDQSMSDVLSRTGEEGDGPPSLDALNDDIEDAASAAEDQRDAKTEKSRKQQLPSSDSQPTTKKIPCVVASCLNATRVRKKTSFHKWPRFDPVTKSLWLAACGRQNIQVVDSQGICGLHFAEDAFEKNYKEELLGVRGKKTLKKGAVPTLNLQAGVDEYVIRKIERMRVNAADGKVFNTNKVKVEVGPAYEHHLKSIAEPQILTIMSNCVVARPNLNKRVKANLDSTGKTGRNEYICRVKGCPFQDEKAFMFCFPEDDYLRNTAWNTVCDLKKSLGNDKNSVESGDRNCWVPRVCSYHFKKEDFELSSAGFRDLKPEAYPSLHLGLQSTGMGMKRAKICLRKLAESDCVEYVAADAATAAAAKSVKLPAPPPAPLQPVPTDELEESDEARINRLVQEKAKEEERLERLREEDDSTAMIKAKSGSDLGQVKKRKAVDKDILQQQEDQARTAASLSGDNYEDEQFDNRADYYDDDDSLPHAVPKRQSAPSPAKRKKLHKSSYYYHYDEDGDGSDDGEELYKPVSAFDRINRPTKNMAVQVDFPDACNLLVYQCVKQLKCALAAKDEEIEHLRALVIHLSSQLEQRKNTMVLATPFVFPDDDDGGGSDDDDGEFAKHIEKFYFLEKEKPQAPVTSNPQNLHVIHSQQPLLPHPDLQSQLQTVHQQTLQQQIVVQPQPVQIQQQQQHGSIVMSEVNNSEVATSAEAVIEDNGQTVVQQIIIEDPLYQMESSETEPEVLSETDVISSPEMEKPKAKRKRKNFASSLEPTSNPDFVRTVCCVPGCPSPVTVAYHKFPDVSSPLYTEWVTNCFGKSVAAAADAGTGGDDSYSHAKVCGQHFSETSFDIIVEMDDETEQARTKTVLKDDAVPTKHLNHFAVRDQDWEKYKQLKGY